MENMEHITKEQLVDELQKQIVEVYTNKKTIRSLLIELEELNAKLHEIEYVKTSFLSNIRNEINNPIAAILGLSNQLTNEEFDTNAVKKIAKLIFKEASSLDFQLRNIHSAAEIEAGDISLQPVVININKTIQSQIAYFRHKINQKKINIIYHPSPNETFKTDPNLFESIIMNLISNAIEFSPDNGDVIISTQLLSDELVFFVRDHGYGMDIKKVNTIFERFKQLDIGTTKKHLGHGLGLAITKEFIDILDGKIDIESELNSGTQIIVSIPGFKSNTDQHEEVQNLANSELGEPEIF
jgi:signal transduction histidine kinase